MGGWVGGRPHTAPAFGDGGEESGIFVCLFVWVGGWVSGWVGLSELLYDCMKRVSGWVGGRRYL